VATWLLRFIVQPFGPTRRGPSDATASAVAELLLAPTATRDRLTAGLYLGADDTPLMQLETALKLAIEADPIEKKMRTAGISDRRAAVKTEVITADEAKLLEQADAAVAKVVEVDDFAPEDLKRQATADNVVPLAAARARPKRTAAKRKTQ
jgi:acyl-CoA dehydrogenase